MNMFKKALEYNNVAKSLNGLYLMVEQLNRRKEYDDISEDLLVFAYIATNQVLDKIEKYKWNGNTRIIVPMIPGEKKTLDYAIVQAVGRLITLSAELGYDEEVEEIMNKGELYYVIEKNIPENFKKML